MKEDLPSVFEDLCEHNRIPFERRRLEKIDQKVTRGLVKKKTQYNDRVLNMNRDEYVERREDFRTQHGEFLWSVLLKGRDNLKKAFPSSTISTSLPSDSR
jgi:hypothetical protein